MTYRLLTAFLTALTLAACDAGSGSARPPATSSVPTAGFTPDSIRAEQLTRFRAGLDSVTELSGGESSRDGLVQAFARAALTGDSTTLRRLQLSRAEFAWLYYPTNPQARPPYDLDPETMWLTASLQGDKGYVRLLGELSGEPYSYAGYGCAGNPSREGENTAYGPCTVKLVRAQGDTSEGRLFGLILERHGRWKFVSYANRMD